MNIIDIANTLKALGESDTRDAYARELGFVHLTLTVEQWEAVKETISMLQLADLVNHKAAQDACPHLLKAALLIRSIADNPGANPDDKISLAPKTRAQLDAAIARAEK